MQGCAVCDRPTAAPFCTDCDRQISQQTSRRAPSLDQASGDLCISALGAYSGALKRAILAMKYSSRPDVARPLGTALARHWLSQQSLSQTIRRSGGQSGHHLYAIPIPLHAGRQQSRGYNQAALIADAFCRVSGVSLLADGLVRSQATQPQHELGLAARQQNLDQAFKIGAPLYKIMRRVAQRSDRAREVSVWLIDDIYTTGATAHSAVRTLEQAGVSVLGIATVARASF